MGTADKKYKFLIQYEDYNPRYKQRADRYPLTCEEDNTKLKCTLEQAIEYAKDKIDGDMYTQALIMSYDPHDCSYNSGVASVTTIPIYLKYKAGELGLNLRKQEDFNYLKEKYKVIYNFVTNIYNMDFQVDEFINEYEPEYNGALTLVEFSGSKMFMCTGNFYKSNYYNKLQLINKLQEEVKYITGVKGLEDFTPRIYKYENWEECLFKYLIIMLLLFPFFVLFDVLGRQK